MSNKHQVKRARRKMRRMMQISLADLHQAKKAQARKRKARK